MANTDYKYRFPSMIVAVIDLAMTILSIYLLVMFFFLAFALSSCLLNPRNDSCTSLGRGGSGSGFGSFGLNFNFEQSSSSSSYSHSVVSSGGRDLSGESSRAGGGNGLSDDDSAENAVDIDIEIDNSHNEVIDFGKNYPGFGFDNRNRDSSRNKQVDLDFGLNSEIDFGKAVGNRRNTERNHFDNNLQIPQNRQPNEDINLDFSFGRKGNQNQKPSGFEWWIQPYSASSSNSYSYGKLEKVVGQDPRSRADFLRFDGEGDKKVSGLTRALFIIIVVVLWIFFVIAVIVEITMIIAAIRLFMATKEGKHPSDALRSAKCWRICTTILIILFVLNFVGGSGRSNLESLVVGGANVLFRIIGVIIVSLYIRELENSSQSQQQQVYYDVGGGENGGQMIPMNGNYNNQQEHQGWNVPKQV